MASSSSSIVPSSSNSTQPPDQSSSIVVSLSTQFFQFVLFQEETESWNVDNWNNEVYKFEQDSLIKNKLGLIVNKRFASYKLL
jgi:hypothetical protein